MLKGLWGSSQVTKFACFWKVGDMGQAIAFGQGQKVFIEDS